MTINKETIIQIILGLLTVGFIIFVNAIGEMIG